MALVVEGAPPLQKHILADITLYRAEGRFLR
jgi:hypothetical protein